MPVMIRQAQDFLEYGHDSWKTPDDKAKKRLTKEEEVALSHKILHGTKEESLKAQDELIRHNWSLPFFILKRKYQWITDRERDAAISDAFEGLAIAARNFNAKKAGFAAFAYLKMSQSINDGLNLRRRWFSGIRMDKTSQLQGVMARNPAGTVEEWAAAIQVQPRTVAIMLRAIQASFVASLDDPDVHCRPDSNQSLVTVEEKPDHQASTKDLAAIVRQAAKLEGIPDEELELISYKGTRGTSEGWARLAKKRGITSRSAQTLAAVSQWKIRRRVYLMLGDAEFRALFGSPPAPTPKKDVWRPPRLFKKYA